MRNDSSLVLSIPRSPGTHIVGPWVIDSINSYRDLRTGTQYIGNWASRVYSLDKWYWAPWTISAPSLSGVRKVAAKVARFQRRGDFPDLEKFSY